MDHPAGSLRGGGAAAPAVAPVGGSEGRSGKPESEERKAPDLAPREGEEVGDDPQLPKEPCFSKPPPLGKRMKDVLSQLASVAGAAGAALKSLGSRSSAGLRGGPSSSAQEVEETSPVVKAQLQASAAKPAEGIVPASAPSGEAGGSIVDNAGEQVADAEETGAGEEEPQPPKGPHSSRSKAAAAGLKKLFLKLFAALAAGTALLKETTARGVSRVGRSQVAVPAVEAGAMGSGSLPSPPAPPSVMDVTPPGTPPPHPDDVASAP